MKRSKILKDLRNVQRWMIAITFFLWSTEKVNAIDLSVNQQIEFVQGVSWQDVIKKAQAENKAILVDCYTTWCVPCKKMDKEVYANDGVSRFYNDKFICYKIQMDSTKNDNDLIRASYSDALYFQDRFKIRVYPTTMFFNPDGKLLHRLEGLVDANDLIKVGQETLDPKKNYYSLLEEYDKGKRDFDAMRVIATTASILLKDTPTAKAVFHEYMALLPKKDYYNIDNIELFKMFTKSTADPTFRFLYNHVDTINKIMDDRMYTQSIVKSIIFTEMLRDPINKAFDEKKEPDWIKLGKDIKKKYSEFYADLLITSLKVDWYRSLKNWKAYAKTVVTYVDLYIVPYDKQGHWPAYTLNNFAWDVFRYSNDNEELKRALTWSNRAVMMDPTANWIDTYANILYKLGETDLAIRWEEIVVKLDPTVSDYTSALQNMKEGKQTWPSN